MQVTDLVIPVSTLKFIRLEEGGGGGWSLVTTYSGKKVRFTEKILAGGTGLRDNSKMVVNCVEI